LEVRGVDNPDLLKGMDKWEDIRQYPEEMRTYEARHKAMMDRLSAVKENERRQQQQYEEGIREGERRKSFDVARKRLRRGVKATEVAEDTGLALEDVYKLERKLQ
jgi:predicted transposase/invertase (TIGR01784 family)